MPKARPKTGEERDVNRTLKIDLLPLAVRDQIQRLRDDGRSWTEIEELSALPKAQGGFVDWDSLPTPVLESFPELKLPHTSLHRWFDLRIAQVAKDVMRRAEQARSLAEAFANAGLEKSDEAVLNAARDIIFGMLQETDDKSRTRAAKALLALAEVMQESRANAIKERKVAVDERKLAQLEKDAELKRKKFEREMDAAEKKITRGEALTADDINRIRERVFGLGPTPRPAA